MTFDLTLSVIISVIHHALDTTRTKNFSIYVQSVPISQNDNQWKRYPLVIQPHTIAYTCHKVDGAAVRNRQHDSHSCIGIVPLSKRPIPNLDSSVKGCPPTMSFSLFDQPTDFCYHENRVSRPICWTDDVRAFVIG